MLTADKAGMGKNTILTDLSKRIKQRNPAHWLLRIDLNDDTELLKAQKRKKMDKGEVLEFISKELLNIESHLERELFKRSFEENEVNKVWFMADSFDKTSPSYKETVINNASSEADFVTAAVGHHPAPPEELEDNLQQLSYTLQPFSEKNNLIF